MADTDLAHAIQAAARAICGWLGLGQGVDGAPATIWAGTAAQIAVEAAAPVLLQATRDRLADLEVYAAEAHDTLAELFDFLNMLRQGAWDHVKTREPHLIELRVRTALRTDPPTRGRAILDQVERLRKVARAVWDSQNAYEPTPQKLRERDWTVVEVGRDEMADLGDALDLGAAQEEGGDG